MKCKRCGQCCHYIDIHGNKKACIFLLPSNLCSIYNNRLGVMIDNNRICNMRDALTQGNYPGCPYNIGE